MPLQSRLGRVNMRELWCKVKVCSISLAGEIAVVGRERVLLVIAISAAWRCGLPLLQQGGRRCFCFSHSGKRGLGS